MGERPCHCWLCSRPLGKRVEWHHPVPKSRGGRAVDRTLGAGEAGRLLVPLHPICHRTLHATFTNATLERIGNDPALIRADPAIGRFLAWIGDKPPDFHAPTRRKA